MGYIFIGGLYMEGILSVLLIVLLFVLGMVYCFAGYKYLKVIILIYALYSGGTFVYNLLTQIAPELGYWIFIIALIAGIVLALLTYFFVNFCFFIAGGIFGIVIFQIIRSASPEYFSSLESLNIFLIGLLFFVGLGIVMLLARKHLIILFSAIYGGFSLVYMGGILIGLLFDQSLIASAVPATATTTLLPSSIFYTLPLYAMIIPMAICSILGIIMQYRKRGLKKV